MADPISTQGLCGRPTRAGRRRDCAHVADARRGGTRLLIDEVELVHLEPTVRGHASRGHLQRCRARVQAADPRRSEGSALPGSDAPAASKTIPRRSERFGRPLRRPAIASFRYGPTLVASMSGPPGLKGHVSGTRALESRKARARRPRLREASGGDREERTLGKRRGAARRGGPYVSRNDPRHAGRSEEDRDKLGSERCWRRQLDDPGGPAEGDDDIITVGIVVDSGDPGRVGRAGIGKRRHTDHADKEQQAQRAP
jgi:hypothetical protein